MKDIHIGSTEVYAKKCCGCDERIPVKKEYFGISRGEYNYPVTICFDCVKKMAELVKQKEKNTTTIDKDCSLQDIS